MARRFVKVSEEEIEEAFFYPSDLVNTKTTIPLRVGEERWIYTSTLRSVKMSSILSRSTKQYSFGSLVTIITNLPPAHGHRYPPLFTSPSGNSCILFLKVCFQI